MAATKSGDQSPAEPSADRGFRVHDRRWWAQESGDEEAAEPTPARPTYVAQLEAKIEEYRAEIASLKGRVSAGLDEVERAKARIERDAARELERGRREFLAGFLEVLDDVDRAVDAARESGAPAAVMDGLELVKRRFLAKLGEHGVRRLEVEGSPFDPQHHDAVAVVAPGDPAQEGRVVHVASPGYAIGDEVLRAPRVVVAKS